MISTRLGPTTESDPDSRPDRGRSAVLLASGPPSRSAMNRRLGLGLEIRGSPQSLAPHRRPNPSSIERACCELREAPPFSLPPLDRASTAQLPLLRHSISSVRTDAIPAPRCAEKTAPLGGDDWYSDPPSKYGPMRRVYGPTHYMIGLTTTALTFKANQANKGHDSEARNRCHQLRDQQGNQ